MLTIGLDGIPEVMIHIKKSEKFELHLVQDHEQ